MPPGNRWKRRDAGPVVRPYALTGGRTEPAEGTALDLIAVVVATGPGFQATDAARRTPEHRKILSLCQVPATVADIVAEIKLPVGVVRVLLSDLISSGAIKVVQQRPPGQAPGDDVLREILNGLRAL